MGSRVPSIHYKLTSPHCPCFYIILRFSNPLLTASCPSWATVCTQICGWCSGQDTSMKLGPQVWFPQGVVCLLVLAGAGVAPCGVTHPLVKHSLVPPGPEQMHICSQRCKRLPLVVWMEHSAVTAMFSSVVPRWMSLTHRDLSNTWTPLFPRHLQCDEILAGAEVCQMHRY